MRTDDRITRLTSADRVRDLRPWKRAEELTKCQLYWMPVASVPVPQSQKQWLLIFLEGLSSVLKHQFGLRSELFLQFKILYPNLMEEFMRSGTQFSPVPGLGRRPGSDFPRLPSIDEVSKEVQSGKIDVLKHLPDLSYWFVDKAEKEQRELFFGEGGMSILFLKPDPKTKAPEIPFSPTLRKQPLFGRIDVDRVHARTFALMDDFQERSKELLGTGLEDNPQFKGLRFILPLLTTRDFFSEPAEEVKKWFELFDVYVTESQADKGIILASKVDLEDHLIQLLKGMREKGLEYQER